MKNSKGPKISVIIPTYNEEKVIGACLISLSHQTFKDFEIIVVDDGSTDDSKRIVRNLESQISNLESFTQNHKGPGEARNLGARKARGQIVVFVDADMTFDNDFITKLVQPIIDGTSKGTFSKDEYVSNWDNVWSRCWNINQGWEEKRRHPRNYPDTQRVFRAILRSEFDRVGGFATGGHYTDDYLSERLGYEADVVRGAKFYHANSDTLKEIFSQAKWAAKREYKFGIVGIFFSLMRSSFPVSLVIGLSKSVLNLESRFVLFKIVYDLGTFIGLLEIIFTNKRGR